jgi:hypothetical protein
MGLITVLLGTRVNMNYMLIGINFVYSGCTKLGRQVAEATKFRWVAPNFCGSLVWNFSGLGAVLQVGRSLVRSQLVSVDFH